KPGGSPIDSSLLFEATDKVLAIGGSRKIVHTSELKYLDKASIVSSIEDRNRKLNYSNSWRLCTVTQVEELKVLIRMFPFWGTEIAFSAVYAQISTMFVEQGMAMDTHIGSFTIPAASLVSFEVISILFWVPVYDKIVVPIARRFTGEAKGFSDLQRALLTTGLGNYLSSFILTVVIFITARDGKPGWIPNNLNEGYYEDCRRTDRMKEEPNQKTPFPWPPLETYNPCCWIMVVELALIRLEMCEPIEGTHGMSINIQKSHLLGVGIPDNCVIEAVKSIGCSIMKAPFKYLGILVGDNMSSIKAWDETISKMKKRLSRWKLNTLSVGGRLTLLKSVLGSTPIYNMLIFKVSKSVLNLMESLRRNFFNGIQDGDRKIAWVKWSKVLASKKYGGLRVSSFYALNRALLFKWVWRYLSHDNSLWSRVISAMHGDWLFFTPF
nr:peptide transporter 1 [Tanacetum cinerariifolium]